MTGLSDELGADPSADLVRLNADVLRSAGPASGSVRRVGLRAAPNALIGREADLAAVTRLLSDARLVTILGAGGLGKTRLAQAAAATVPAACGVVVVELAPLTTGEDVVPAIGALLGLAEVRSARSLRDAVIADLRTRVVRALGEEPTLLVLDNCEHILEPVAAFAADLLAVLPGLRILTTSRAPLAVAGEVVAPLAPLPVEADGAAVRLFTDRARAARPGAVLPVDAVRRICTRLDGSPLAIELAAARIRGMSVDEIERRLDDRFALLRGGDRSAPERHRTLLAVIEWSWRLLDAGARDLLTRLALFPDGLSVDAVEAVAPPERLHDALDDLAELVEQSLVQLVEQEGEPVRYRLLETVREFGAARLEESGATADVRAAMTRWACRTAAGHDLFIVRTTDQVARFRVLEREADNLVTMLRWALRAGDPVAVAPLFSALAGYWSFRGAHGEVAAIAPDVVAALRTLGPGGGDPANAPASDPGVRTAAVLGLVIACATAAFTDRRTSVRARAALRRLRRTGVTGVPVVDAQAELLLTLGRRSVGEAALARLREDPDAGVACLAHLLSAPLTENDGELERALGFATRARVLAEQAGDVWTSGTAAVSVTQLAGQLGRYDQALDAADAARARLEQFGAEDDLIEVGWSVGLSAAATGDVERARTLATELAALPASTAVGPVGGPGGGPGGERAQMALLAHAVRAEVARAEGDPVRAVGEYRRAWDGVLPHRRAASQWVMIVGAALLAAQDESGGRGGGWPVRRGRDGPPGRPGGPCGRRPTGPGERPGRPPHPGTLERPARGGDGRPRRRTRGDQPRCRRAHPRPRRRSLGQRAPARCTAGLRGPRPPTPPAAGGRRGRRGTRGGRRDGLGRDVPGRGRRCRACGARGDQAFRMYARTVSGANTATMTAAPSRLSHRSPPTVPWLTRSRTAVMRCETGFTSENQCSQSGRVSAGTNAFDRNVSGKSTRFEMPETLDAVRATTPK